MTASTDRGRAREAGRRLQGVKRQIRSVIHDPETAIAIVEVALEALPPARTRVREVVRAALAANAVEEMLMGDLDALSNDLLVQARIGGEAKRALLHDDALLTGAQVSALLGSKSDNPRQYPNKLRARGALIGIPRKNQFLYPTFQFDRKRKAVFPEIAKVGKLLHSSVDPWGTLSWWISPHARLTGGRAPRDLLGTPQSETIVKLAEAVVEPVG